MKTVRYINNSASKKLPLTVWHLCTVCIHTPSGQQRKLESLMHLWLLINY